MVTGTGQWWARLTATEPTMRCMPLDELPDLDDHHVEAFAARARRALRATGVTARKRTAATGLS